MTRTLLPACGAALAAGLLAAPGLAAEQKAHEHGHGTLNVVAAGGALQIELIVPGADIVGFEHEPKTDADKKAVRDAVAKLEDGVVLFGLPADAGCALDSAEIESALIEKDGHDHGHSHNHNHGHSEDGEEHAEFHAEYKFTCTSMDNLKALDLAYFKTFSGAEELDVQAITISGQTSAELTPENASLTLK